MATNPLRNIPSVNELLESPTLKGLVDRISHSTVAHSVRTVLDEVRHEFQTATSERSLPSVSELADRIARRVLEGEPSALRGVINATGVLLPGNLGRAPLAEEAVAAMASVAGDYANVELDLATGKHHRRMHALEESLRYLTGAEAALVVNNTAGAVMATLAALAAGREVVVARGQMAEIGCSYRLPEVIAAAGAIAREVGTANKTYVADYAAATDAGTAAILLVRPTNYQVTGAAADVSTQDVIELGRRHKVPVIHCLGYGSLVDLEPLGLPHEPVVPKCIAAGTDLVLFSGDKLVGGPQCGILVGRHQLIDKIQKHPLARATRVSSPTLAALAATLDLYHDPEQVRQRIPLLQLLATSVDNLRNRAQRLAPQIQATRSVRSAEVVESTTSLAGNALPEQVIPTCTIVAEPQEISADRLAGLLRQSSPPIIARVENDRLVLDLRSVFPRQDIRLVEAIEAIAPQPAEEPAEQSNSDHA
ncbi:MAG: L-seryl-tRNA(Sec) selenium transferase [Planctomycetaceae bacterium]|nr:L-seryl-tRNA(Sec) selenium transferase [Planctomycetaceae bacterium]